MPKSIEKDTYIDFWKGLQVRHEAIPDAPFYIVTVKGADQATLPQFSRAMVEFLGKAIATKTIIVDDNVDIETIPESAMNRAGWFRKEPD